MSSIISSNETSRLPADLQLICDQLGITVTEQNTISDLEEMYHKRATAMEIIVMVTKGGLKLPVVAECLRLQSDIVELGNSSINTVSQIIDGVGFSSTSIDELSIKSGHTLVNGKSISPKDYIRMRKNAAASRGKKDDDPTSVLYAPHDLIIDPMVEAVAKSGCDDPGKELVKTVKDLFDGDYIGAYNLLMEDEEMFFAVTGLAPLDPDRITNEEDGYDILHNVTEMGRTPADFGLDDLEDEEDDDEDEEEHE